MKRFLLFCICLCSSFCCSMALNIHVTKDGFRFDMNMTDGVATLMGNSYSGNIVVPEKVVYDNQEYPVVAIGEMCFYNRTNLISVKIPNSVKSIGKNCFYECQSLTSVELPNSIDALLLELYFFEINTYS